MPSTDERTRRQRLHHWFWMSRVGLALNLLLGRSTVFRLNIVDGAIVVPHGEVALFREVNIS
jgi:hypothetical protein